MSFSALGRPLKILKRIKENIDGKKLNSIISRNSYREEVLYHLKYADIIIWETNKKLIGTNFLSLIKILHQSLEQL